jgi:hypothetical protein
LRWTSHSHSHSHSPETKTEPETILHPKDVTNPVLTHG